MIRGGKILVFDNDVIVMQKTFGFFEKLEIISPFTVRGGIEGILLLSFSLNSSIYFSLAANIISVHLFDLVSAFSKSAFSLPFL